MVSMVSIRRSVLCPAAFVAAPERHHTCALMRCRALTACSQLGNADRATHQGMLLFSRRPPADCACRAMWQGPWRLHDAVCDLCLLCRNAPARGAGSCPAGGSSWRRLPTMRALNSCRRPWSRQRRRLTARKRAGSDLRPATSAAATPRSKVWRPKLKRCCSPALWRQPSRRRLLTAALGPSGAVRGPR